MAQNSIEESLKTVHGCFSIANDAIQACPELRTSQDREIIKSTAGFIRWTAEYRMHAERNQHGLRESRVVRRPTIVTQHYYAVIVQINRAIETLGSRFAVVPTGKLLADIATLLEACAKDTAPKDESTHVLAQALVRLIRNECESALSMRQDRPRKKRTRISFSHV